MEVLPKNSTTEDDGALRAFPLALEEVIQYWKKQVERASGFYLTLLPLSLSSQMGVILRESLMLSLHTTSELWLRYFAWGKK